MKAIFTIYLFVLSAMSCSADLFRRTAVLETVVNAGPPAIQPREHRFFMVDLRHRGMTDDAVETRILAYDSRTLRLAGTLKMVEYDHACLDCDTLSPRLYVGWEKQRRIEALDSRSGAVLWSAVFPSSSWTLAVSRRHPRLYVRFPDEVHVLDTRSGHTLQTLEARASLAPNPVVEDGWIDRAFVVTTRNVLLALNLADGSVSDMDHLSEKPYTDRAPPPSLAVDEGRHRLFALQRWPYNRLLVYDTRSLQRIVTALMPEGVRDLTIDRRSGNVVVLALDPPRILLVDGRTGRIKHVQTMGVVSEPWVPVLDDDTHRLFVRSLGRIAVYDSRITD